MFVSLGELTLLTSSDGWMAISFHTLAYCIYVQMISIQKEKYVRQNLFIIEVLVFTISEENSQHLFLP
jgi:hypothetical protein